MCNIICKVETFLEQREVAFLSPSKLFLLYQGIGKGLGNLESKLDKNIVNLNF